MTFCPSCGATTPTGASFCGSCGTRLAGPSPGARVPRRPPGGTNGSAVAALVLGILGWLTVVLAPLAIVFGHVERHQIRRSGESGRGMATAGLVLGYLAVVVVTGVVAVLLLAGRDGDRTTPSAAQTKAAEISAHNSSWRYSFDPNDPVRSRARRFGAPHQ